MTFSRSRRMVITGFGLGGILIVLTSFSILSGARSAMAAGAASFAQTDAGISPTIPSPAVTSPALSAPRATPTPTATTRPTWTASPTWTTTPLITPVPITTPYTVQPNRTYCTVGGVALLADVYTPLTEGAERPLIVYVHGGGWYKGDKTDVVTHQPEVDALNYLTANGYVVAAVNYRLAPTYPFPAMIEDVKCAVRYFRANATLYGVDSRRIGAWGSSAGGHLANLLGTTDASAGWDVGQYPWVSSRVETVADWFGPTDIYQLYVEAKANHSDVAGDVVQAFGTPTSANYAPDSPVTYVTSDDAPTIIQHGVDDVEVYPEQSQEFDDDLTAAHVSNELVWVQNAGHGFVPTPTRAQINPSLDEIAQEVVGFFDVYLKNNPNPEPQ